MKNIKIQKLERYFTGTGDVEGMNFIQMFSNDKAYIYRVKNKKIKKFEVFERRKTPVLYFEKNIYSDTEFKEIYPQTEDFGVWAWTFSDIKKACEKFAEISRLY